MSSPARRYLKEALRRAAAGEPCQLEAARIAEKAGRSGEKLRKRYELSIIRQFQRRWRAALLEKCGGGSGGGDDDDDADEAADALVNKVEDMLWGTAAAADDAAAAAARRESGASSFRVGDICCLKADHSKVVEARRPSGIGTCPFVSPSLVTPAGAVRALGRRRRHLAGLGEVEAHGLRRRHRPHGPRRAAAAPDPETRTQSRRQGLRCAVPGRGPASATVGVASAPRPRRVDAAVAPRRRRGRDTTRRPGADNETHNGVVVEVGDTCCTVEWDDDDAVPRVPKSSLERFRVPKPPKKRAAAADAEKPPKKKRAAAQLAELACRPVAAPTGPRLDCKKCGMTCKSPAGCVAHERWCDGE